MQDEKSNQSALILDRRTIAALMTPREYVDALEDVASAAWIWQRAVTEKVCFHFTFGAI